MLSFYHFFGSCHTDISEFICLNLLFDAKILLKRAELVNEKPINTVQLLIQDILASFGTLETVHFALIFMNSNGPHGIWRMSLVPYLVIKQSFDIVCDRHCKRKIHGCMK